jgi:hypothetical protein
VIGPSFPRRRQYRHTAAAAGYLTAAVLAVGLALELATSGNGTPALVLVALVGGLGGAGRRRLGLAHRNRVGANSERRVRRELDRLRRDGWQVRHGVDWPGGGDIDHLLRSPAGVGYVVETKTRSFEDRHLQRTARAAGWAAGRRRRYPRGVVPVLCVVRSRDRERYHGEVLVVSADRLVAALRNRGA